MHNFSYVLTRIHKSLLDWKSVGLGALDKGIRDTELQLQALELEDIGNTLFSSHILDYRALQHRFNALLR